MIMSDVKTETRVSLIVDDITIWAICTSEGLIIDAYDKDENIIDTSFTFHSDYEEEENE